MSVLTAGIGALVCGKPPDILRALALGSCIGLVIFDPVSKISVLTHILLPGRPKSGKTNLLGKYADEAPIESVRKILKKGGRRSNLVAKMTGGAKMFDELLVEGYLDIGTRNIEKVTKTLKKLAIPIAGQDVGGRLSRTVKFDTSTGLLTIKNATRTQTTII